MPSHQSRRQAEEQASQAWDAIARGIAPDSAASDPTLIETMRRLQALGEQPRPDPVFSDRLEDELTRAMTSNLALMPSARTLANVPNGRLTLLSPPPPLPRLEPSRRRWALAQLATAALVLLSLLGSFVVFRGPLRLMTHDEQPAVIPAIDASSTVPVVGTPMGERPASGMTDMILLQGTFTEIPRDASWAGLERATLQPGATRALGKHENEGEGPMIYRVESGKLVINADGPITITRAGETTSTTIPPRTDVVLGVDDEGFTPSGVTSLWRNEGSIPAVVLDAAITTFGAGPNSGGLVDSHGLNLIEFVEQWPITAPATPVTVTAHRLTLAPGDRIVPSQYRGLAGFYVVGGPLRVIDDPGSGSRPQTFDVPDGNGRVFGGSGYKSVPTTWTLENAGGDPISLLMLTITSANPLEATPMS